MTQSDPLISALVAKLPDPGTDWPVERQLAWLKMMAMGFGVVYGGNVAVLLQGDGEAAPAVQSKAPPAPALPAKPKPIVHKFVIDKDNYVKRGTGQRVMPSDINSEVVDLRGEGELSTIVWADGTIGLNGADLTITAA